MPTATDTLRLNPRVAAMQPSATLAMTARAKQLRREGRPVIGLSAGEPDFDTPAPICQAAIEAIHAGFTHYTQNPGMPELREKIAAKLARDNGLDVTPEQILCSNGAKQSVALAINALCAEGDDVLIPAPYWVSYPEMARMAGAHPVALPTSAEAEYRVAPDALEAAITDRTRLYIHCSPSNPTGSVYPREELETLAEVFRRHPHVYILADEIYEYVTFDAEHVSLGAMPGLADRVITVNGFSKGFAMTGWRLGYLAAPLPITRACAKIQSQFTSAPCSITQKAGVGALDMMATDPSPVYEMVAAFRERRDYVLSRLRSIEGVRCPTPEGAFYLFPDVSAFLDTTTPSGRPIATSEDLCFYLLEEHDIALVPGTAFGTPSGLRISYAASMDDLETALDRVERGLAGLS